MREKSFKDMLPMILGIIAGFIVIAGILALIKHNLESEGQTEPTHGSMMLDTRADRAGEDGNELADLLADREVYFAGIEDAEISDSTEILLENMKENDDILMQYIITDKDTGEVYEETGLIPAGSHIAWVPGKQLKSGSYTLIFHEKPFYPYEGDMIALTQGNNEVTITIQ